MILSSPPLVLSPFLIAAATYFVVTPVVESAAVVPFETRDELKTAVDHYCGGTFFGVNLTYG